MDRKEPDFNAKAQRRRGAEAQGRKKRNPIFCAFASPRLCVEIWAFQPVRCSRSLVIFAETGAPPALSSSPYVRTAPPPPWRHTRLDENHRRLREGAGALGRPAESSGRGRDASGRGAESSRRRADAKAWPRRPRDARSQRLWALRDAQVPFADRSGSIRRGRSEARGSFGSRCGGQSEGRGRQSVAADTFCVPSGRPRLAALTRRSCRRARRSRSARSTPWCRRGSPGKAACSRRPRCAGRPGRRRTPDRAWSG